MFAGRAPPLSLSRLRWGLFFRVSRIVPMRASSFTGIDLSLRPAKKGYFMKVSFRILILLSAVFTSSGAALAGSLPSPSGPVILTVTGGIENTNAAGAAKFDLEMLRAVDDSEIVTDTIWTRGITVSPACALTGLWNMSARPGGRSRRWRLMITASSSRFQMRGRTGRSSRIQWMGGKCPGGKRARYGSFIPTLPHRNFRLR